jgi:pimeloyl-ACP methyl ester carboxylesterase
VGVVESALTASDISFPVALRGTGAVQIHASVFASGAKVGETVLAVHGLAGTGFTFRPLADAIFADRTLKTKIARVVAIDMPWHGDSGLPANLPNGAKFGDLAIEDNVSVIIQSIMTLKALNLAPTIAIGHSMGGLEVQVAQQALLAQGSSFAKLGIRGVVLLAPVPPHGLPWVYQSFAPPATQLIVTDPAAGTYLAYTPEVVASATYLSRATGTLVPNAPTTAQALANDYVGPEPLIAGAELVEATLPLPTGGTITLQRPSVAPGAFALTNGTLTAVVSFNNDIFLVPSELKGLYEYLTGDSKDVLYVPVVAADAVHGMYLSNPKGMLAAIRCMY